MKKKPNGYWNYERCAQAARLCSGPYELKRKYTSAFHKAYQMGWFDSIRQEMYDDGIWKRPFRWNEDSAARIALNYDTRKEFENGNNGAYIYARANGILDKICTHMKRQASFSERYLYAFVFDDGYAYIGLAIRPEERKARHLSDHNSAVYKHIHSTGSGYNFSIISDMMDYEQAAEMEIQKIVEYRERGYKMLNTLKGGQLGWVNCTTTNEDIAEIAAKCKNRTEFQKLFGKIYQLAIRRGIYEQVCAHMPKPRPKTTDIYSEDDIKRICSECNTYGELYKKNKSIYNILAKQHRQWDFFEPTKHKKWTEDDKHEVIEAVKKCKNLEELHRKYCSFYRMIFKFHWEEDFLEFRNGRWHLKGK